MAIPTQIHYLFQLFRAYTIHINIYIYIYIYFISLLVRREVLWSNYFLILISYNNMEKRLPLFSLIERERERESAYNNISIVARDRPNNMP
jgi:hypothetical protein